VEKLEESENFKTSPSISKRVFERFRNLFD